MIEVLLARVENIVENGENAGHSFSLEESKICCLGKG